MSTERGLGSVARLTGPAASLCKYNALQWQASRLSVLELPIFSERHDNAGDWNRLTWRFRLICDKRGRFLRIAPGPVSFASRALAVVNWELATNLTRYCGPRERTPRRVGLCRVSPHATRLCEPFGAKCGPRRLNAGVLGSDRTWASRQRQQDPISRDDQRGKLREQRPAAPDISVRAASDQRR